MLDDRPTIGTLQNAQILVGVMVPARLHDRQQRVQRVVADLAAEHAGGIMLGFIVGHVCLPLRYLVSHPTHRE
mgnify:FL=1